MKYGYFFPVEFKNFMYKYGGDTQFGSCRFEYPENIISNLLRVPGYMDFHLIPFGDVGNGDYYCFYRYGSNINDYFVGIWLHETRNFVILASNFKSFMYKCLLDDYLSTVIPNEDISDIEYAEASAESIERCRVLSEEFGFDFEKVKNMKSEFDYHRLMIEYDEKALQSLCFMGKELLKKKDIRGFDILDSAKDICYFYTAPYYLAGKTLLNIGRGGREYLKKALKTSLVCTGYSYWQEDYLEIPEGVHREVALLLDRYLENSDDYFERELYRGRDPYDYELRYEMAKYYMRKRNYDWAMIEYNNAIFCSEDKKISKAILKEALVDAKEAGMHYLINIIEHDIRILR
nr:SMI1/KNR4 family protein [Fonticella tunisiensis]